MTMAARPEMAGVKVTVDVDVVACVPVPVISLGVCEVNATVEVSVPVVGVMDAVSVLVCAATTGVLLGATVGVGSA